MKVINQNLLKTTNNEKGDYNLSVSDGTKKVLKSFLMTAI